MQFQRFITAYVSLFLISFVIFVPLRPPSVLRYLRDMTGATEMNISGLPMSPNPKAAPSRSSPALYSSKISQSQQSEDEEYYSSPQERQGEIMGQGAASSAATFSSSSSSSDTPNTDGIVKNKDKKRARKHTNNRIRQIAPNLLLPSPTKIEESDLQYYKSYFYIRLPSKVKMTCPWNLFVDYTFAFMIVDDFGLKYVPGIDANIVSLIHPCFAVACVYFLITSLKEVPIGSGNNNNHHHRKNHNNAGVEGESNNNNNDTPREELKIIMANNNNIDQDSEMRTIVSSPVSLGSSHQRMSSMRSLSPSSPLHPSNGSHNNNNNLSTSQRATTSHLRQISSSVANDALFSMPPANISSPPPSLSSTTTVVIHNNNNNQDSEKTMNSSNTKSNQNIGILEESSKSSMETSNNNNSSNNSGNSTDFNNNSDDDLESTGLIIPTTSTNTNTTNTSNTPQSTRIVQDANRLRYAGICLFLRNFIDNVDGVLARQQRKLGMQKSGFLKDVDGHMIDATADTIGAGICLAAGVYVLWRLRAVVSPPVSRFLTRIGFSVHRRDPVLFGKCVSFVGILLSIAATGAFWDNFVMKYASVFEPWIVKYAADLVPVESCMQVRISMFTMSCINGDCILLLVAGAMIFNVLWEAAQYMFFVFWPCLISIVVYAFVVWNGVVMKNSTIQALKDIPTDFKM